MNVFINGKNKQWEMKESLKKRNKKAPTGGLEPPTTRLRAWRSTDWARRACWTIRILFSIHINIRSIFEFHLNSDLYWNQLIFYSSLLSFSLDIMVWFYVHLPLFLLSLRGTLSKQIKKIVNLQIFKKMYVEWESINIDHWIISNRLRIFVINSIKSKKKKDKRIVLYCLDSRFWMHRLINWSMNTANYWEIKSFTKRITMNFILNWVKSRILSNCNYCHYIWRIMILNRIK